MSEESLFRFVSVRGPNAPTDSNHASLGNGPAAEAILKEIEEAHKPGTPFVVTRRLVSSRVLGSDEVYGRSPSTQALPRLEDRLRSWLEDASLSGPSKNLAECAKLLLRDSVGKRTDAERQSRWPLNDVQFALWLTFDAAALGGSEALKRIIAWDWIRFLHIALSVEDSSKFASAVALLGKYRPVLPIDFFVDPGKTAALSTPAKEAVSQPEEEDLRQLRQKFERLQFAITELSSLFERRLRGEATSVAKYGAPIRSPLGTESQQSPWVLSREVMGPLRQLISGLAVAGSDREPLNYFDLKSGLEREASAVISAYEQLKGMSGSYAIVALKGRK